MDELLAPIFAEIRRRGLSEAAVSKEAVGNPSALKNLRVRRGGGTRNHPIENLQAVAEYLGLRISIGAPEAGSETLVTEIHGEAFAAVPRYDAQLAAGSGHHNHDSPPVGAIAFRRDWLKRENIAPGQAMVVGVRGDSMAPTLCDGDLVMIDRRRTTPINRRIYALVGPGDEARVKRVERLPTALLLHSDNEDFSTEIIAPQDANRIRILGEVVWWGHTVRE